MLTLIRSDLFIGNRASTFSDNIRKVRAAVMEDPNRSYL